jgi:hypothetical protein
MNKIKSKNKKLILNSQKNQMYYNENTIVFHNGELKKAEGAFFRGTNAKVVGIQSLSECIFL